MYCPKKYSLLAMRVEVEFTPTQADELLQCEQSQCALWNSHFAMCSQAVLAHLEAVKDQDAKDKEAFYASRNK
jgi:hypothetical protein